MKAFLKFLILPLLTLTLLACGSSQNSQMQGSGKNSPSSYKATITTNLTEVQKADLLFMWEEEKMARDVYSNFSSLYGDKSFSQIKKSEQAHMDSIRYLLDQLQLNTPVDEVQVGIFLNPEIQNLYNSLIARGQVSLNEAYQVGYDIEVVDIEDLSLRLSGMTDPGIRSVYEKLLSASEKHKSAFLGKL